MNEQTISIFHISKLQIKINQTSVKPAVSYKYVWFNSAFWIFWGNESRFYRIIKLEHSGRLNQDVSETKRFNFRFLIYVRYIIRIVAQNNTYIWPSGWKYGGEEYVLKAKTEGQCVLCPPPTSPRDLKKCQISNLFPALKFNH